ncbi:hypothetical protein TRAPUB_3591 [Trametes pubescens]|uniref:Uncharacterized protein n=1 Tax=Trametes pubescens TaxID=154538 RepID=A0A1M2VDG5_TRAPU|nr:hypothetical protein TRAPUB_3591 [Trametes pubescens]
MDLPTLQTWRTTCVVADRVVSSFLQACYHNALSSHFIDVAGFRAVLRATGAVVSGSAALRTLDRNRAHGWRSNDVDVYTPVHQTERIIRYINEVEGYYALEASEPYAHYSVSGYMQVFRYRNADGAHIDVVQSYTHSAIFPIPFFWSSHVMNYMTADAFCVAYPVHTLQGRGLMSPVALLDDQHAHDPTLAVMHKYRSRGYDFRLYTHAWTADATTECSQSANEGCPRTIRFFGDRYCLIGSFGTVSETVQSTECRAQPDKTRLVRWWRGGNACGGNCRHTHPGTIRTLPHVGTHRVNPEFFDTLVRGRVRRDSWDEYTV